MGILHMRSDCSQRNVCPSLINIPTTFAVSRMIVGDRHNGTGS